MRLERHDDPARFLEHARPFLEASEAANCLIIGIAGTLARHPDDAAGAYLATVSDGGSVVGAALMTPPRNLIASAMPAAAVESLVEDLLASDIPVPGLLAPEATAALLTSAWTRRTGQTWSLRMRQRTHQLDRPEPIPSVSGSFRRAEPEDLPLLIDWAHGFLRDIPTLEDAPEEMEMMVRTGVAEGRYYLWCDPEPVTMAAWGGGTWRGARIYHVYTPAELRRRGYATACVAALTEHLLATGNSFCFLNTDLSNPTSNAIYARIGYRPVCDSEYHRREGEGRAGM